MPIQVTVLYPNEDDSQFDMDYYLAKHMPLVSENWQQYGLKGWEVVQFARGADGAKPLYKVQATLRFDSKEDFGKAMGSSEAATVLGDIPNFTNTQPVLIAGDTLKTQSH
jgi:uncharacterized protein (TIGR02118 family)